MSEITVPNNNVLEFLRTIPLSRLTYEQKCDLKNKRPTPLLSIKDTTKRQTRTFQPSWYTRYKWLTGCVVKNKMYCYVCIMMGKHNSEWCTEGVSDLNNFIKKAEKHQSSKQHLLHSQSFHLLESIRIEHALSESARLQTMKHNEEVSSNRRILARLIQATIFLSKQELAFRGHRENESSGNRGNYLELLDLLAQNESLIRDHLQSNSLFKGTSPDIQTDLIEVITSVLNEKIKNEIEESSFVSVQADETLDVSCKSQMSIIFRYCIEDRIEERFVGFYDVYGDKTALGLSEVLRKVLSEWQIAGNKVVFTAIIDDDCLWDGDSQNCAVGLKRHMDDPMFVYLLCVFEACFVYIEPLFRLLQSTSASITVCHAEIHLAIRNLENLREDIFIENCVEKNEKKQLPPQELLKYFVTTGLDSIYQETTKLLRLILTFPAMTASSERTSRKVTDKEVCDVISAQAKERFLFTGHLMASHLFSTENFMSFNKNFPEEGLFQACQAYPFVDTSKLGTELEIMYMREDFWNVACAVDLFEFIIQNNFSEALKVLKVLTTTPMTTSEAENCSSTLRMTKSFLHNTMSQERLTALAMLSTEKQLVEPGREVMAPARGMHFSSFAWTHPHTQLEGCWVSWLLAFRVFRSFCYYRYC
ncbi:hypothetical protein ANN_00225 [Periplaneta americana]|uniref:Uncharacterized protein n=1 Tax=Periplaneta americana TaxID=6978 RepID=A0ABQ8TTE4_PERAM|nr:hypothetical protein ANN_00225 [Periplaneta americana]